MTRDHIQFAAESDQRPKNETVVFANLDEATRAELRILALGRGYRVMSYVTKFTDIVVFNREAIQVDPEVKRAIELALGGESIELMSEADFRDALER